MNIHTTRLIRVGNSRGVRIPKLMIDQAGLGDEVEISVRQEGLIIGPVHGRRAGWEAQFAALAAQGDDRLLDAYRSAEWDGTEWKW
jgi:antitoxin MazE